MSTTTIQNDINQVYSIQQSNQFSTQRYELMFEPGTYNVTVPVGFYTEVVGLGQSPTQTVITGGGIYTDASWFSGNATQNFWRDVENITIDPSSGSTEWAASQAAPLRRVKIIGNAVLADNNGWASGGFIADSEVTGQVDSESQQQYISRNDQFGSWTSSSWNMVFVGDTGVPGQSFPNPPDTTVSQTPTVDEKPCPYIDSSGNWDVFVPSNRTSAQGVSWANGNTPGTSLPISDFYIATPSSTVSQINAALAGGKDLLFTPGVYQINGTINVTNPDTVVLGLGLATLVSNSGDTILRTADVNGIRIGGLLFDAGTTNTPVLVQIGPPGSAAGHASDPTVLSDVFAGIGGATVGKATETLQINSSNVIGDDLWLWRADHGNNGTVGWTTNTAANGLVVNGADVTMYGPRRRALPGRPDPMERQRRSRLLLPERDALRPAERVQLDGRLLRRLPLRQRRQHRDQLQGLRTRRLLRLRRQQQRRQHQRDHRTEHLGRAVQRHGHHLPRRGRHHQPRHQRNRRRGQLQQRENRRNHLQLGLTTDPADRTKAPGGQIPKGSAHPARFSYENSDMHPSLHIPRSSGRSTKLAPSKPSRQRRRSTRCRRQRKRPDGL
jgi:hypothetical protein